MKLFRRAYEISTSAAAARLAVVAAAAMGLAACQDNSSRLASGRAYKPIPAETVALMNAKGSDSHAPVLIRSFKKEAELEVWKMKKDGAYEHIKTYPMCRWSGQLGPKTREGDRQVPEGFYAITPAQMNPNSAYYLSFNTGYPNAYDKAHGYSGGLIMVHGDCSSAGCFSMTDDQIAEIYAIAREAFAGGQRSIQMQSMPFRMTPENLAKYRLDQNMPFWKSLKAGYDSFEVTRQEPQVAVCGKRYVFNASANGQRLDASAACPPLQENEQLKNAVAQKDRDDQAKVAELIAQGVKPIRTIYADGGQNAAFQHVSMTSRPEALAQGPREIELDDKGKPVPALVQIAAAKAVAPKPVAPAPVKEAASVKPAAAPAKDKGETVIPTAAPAEAAASKSDAPFYSGIVSSFSSISDLISGSKPEAKPVEQASAAPVAAAPGKKPAVVAKKPAIPMPAPKPQAKATPAAPQKDAQASPIVPAGSMAEARGLSPALR
jgi:murein L,D-transpeptidase YafK